MIYTSDYKNGQIMQEKHYRICSISGDKGQQAGYQGKSFKNLAPKK